MENDSIEMKIAKIAARNWKQQQPTTIEEAAGITWGSEVAAINGMARVLDLDSEDVEKLVGTKAEDGKQNFDGQIYTQDVISEDIASKIRSAFYRADKNELVLEILSTIHNEWVKKNSNNFLKVNENGERRNKERQFVPLELLNWGEVQSDLLFLQPILEASGIELDEYELRDKFEVVQQEFLIDNGITSHEKLVEFLSKGAKSYPTLEGIETKFGGNIEQLLKDPTIAEEMAGQIESKVKIKSKKEMAKEIIDSKNPEMDEIFWADTIADNPNFSKEKCPRINGPISRREILLSKTIGIPYPEYITSGILDHNHEEYKNEIRRPRESELDIVDKYKDTLANRVSNMRLKVKQKLAKDLLLHGSDEIGIATHNFQTITRGVGTKSEVMPKKIFDLGREYGIGFPPDIHIWYDCAQMDTPKSSSKVSTFEVLDANSPIVQKRQKQLSDFQKKVFARKDGEYDKPGIISIPEYTTNSGEEFWWDKTPYFSAYINNYIEIEITQRELAEAGILPEDFKWRKKAKVSSKDIAEADREQALTTTEVGGVKGFISKLLDKFKGIGEK